MFKKILVPLDGSELAECALPYVKSLVKDGFAELIEGDRPASMIADYAYKNGIDLIIIATRGYTGLVREDPGSGKKMLLGSVALKVLHNSDVPVMLIRAQSP